MYHIVLNKWYIKYFEDGDKIEDDNVYLGYMEIWNKIKKAST